jgi:hypothetical protein
MCRKWPVYAETCWEMHLELVGDLLEILGEIATLENA